MTFQSFFHDIFQFFMTLGLSVTFENFQNYPCFRVIQLKRHKLQCLPKCVSFALFNYSPLSYVVVLALTFAVTNRREIFLKFSMAFQYQQFSKFHNFPGLESEIRKFLDFQVFHDLYEPRVTAKETDPRPGRYLSHSKQDM